MNMTMKKLAAAITTMVLTSGVWAIGVTDGSTLTMSATVENACAISDGAVAWGVLALEVNAGLGTVTAANHDADSGASISIACTNGASAAITGGLGANSLFSVRRMVSGSDYLDYELYTSNTRNTVLDATNGAIAYTGTGAATTDKAVYGRITGAQLAAAKKGTYGDTVALTITYAP